MTTPQPVSRVQMAFTLPYTTFEEGRCHVAHCPPLDVSSQGETVQEARENLITALQAFLESCYERGVLDEVLKESGFRPSSPSGASPGDDEHTLNVPFDLLGNSNAEAVAG